MSTGAIKLEDRKDTKDVSASSRPNGAAAAAAAAVTPESLSTTAKRRMRTSREEMAILESYYKNNPNPNQQEKQQISQVVQMAEKSVHFWFQNRRAKDNKRRRFLEGNNKGKKNPTGQSNASHASTVHHKGRHSSRHQQQPKPTRKCHSKAAVIASKVSSTSSGGDGGDRTDLLFHTGHNAGSAYLSDTRMEHYHDPATSAYFPCGVYNQQQVIDNRYNLPPISAIVKPQHYSNNDDITCSSSTTADLPGISFYFHHPDFGIESCMTQWAQYHQYHQGNAVIGHPATGAMKGWQQHTQRTQQQH